MNTQFNTPAARITSVAGSIIASVVVTFGVLSLIANYALPDQSQSGAITLAAAKVAPAR
jgi:hypothetical protein